MNVDCYSMLYKPMGGGAERVGQLFRVRMIRGHIDHGHEMSLNYSKRIITERCQRKTDYEL